MKKCIALLILTLLSAGAAKAADGEGSARRDMALLDSTIIVGTEECHNLSLDFTNIDTQTVIAVYAKLSGVELITDSHAKVVHTPISIQVYGLTQSQQISLMERGLREQAGIVIRWIGDHRAAVTFDSLLPRTIGEEVSKQFVGTWTHSQVNFAMDVKPDGSFVERWLRAVKGCSTNLVMDAGQWHLLNSAFVLTTTNVLGYDLRSNTWQSIVYTIDQVDTHRLIFHTDWETNLVTLTRL